MKTSLGTLAKHLSKATADRQEAIIVLPTESEWEYACRAGTKTPFHFGETISTDQANYCGGFVYGKGKKGIYREKMTPVGSFPANAWGITVCTATPDNGARTGMAISPKTMSSIHKGARTANSV